MTFPSALVTLVCILIACRFVRQLESRPQNHGTPLQNVNGNGSDMGLPVIFDIICNDVYEKPYILDLPYPYGNCNLFVKCSERWPGKPIGDVFPCPEGQNGPLYFSMESCNCEFKEDAVCYDSRNSTHVDNMFKCACPLIPDGAGNFIKDDRCSH